jgi:hypothetical protein
MKACFGFAAILLTIFVPLLAQINQNAASGSYAQLTSKPIFDVKADYGAKGDGSTNDLTALQNAVNAADAAGGGTVFLPCGNYFIGTGQWSIGNASTQHHVNVLGVNPICSQITSTDTGTNTAIYLNTEKYVTLSGFYLHQTTQGNGVGIVMSGPSSGTQTNGDIFSEIIIDNFNVCIGTSGSPGVGTSSEITFINLQLNSCTTGFNNADFNGLDFTFIQLQMASNTTGINMATSGLNVFGGSASNDGTDFAIANGGENTIHGFRSEVAGTFVNFTGSNLHLESVLVQGMTTPNSHTAITFTGGGQLTIVDSYIGGQISAVGFSGLILKNDLIIDGTNTYSLTTQPNGQGPGFRFTNGGSSGDRFEGTGNIQLNWNGTAAVAVGFWPNGLGYIYADQGTSSTTAHIFNLSQGPALTVTSNAIQPSDYIHHIGAGLIKNITVTDTYSVALPENCFQAIPDAAFTTDATGNISKASTAVVGQMMTLCYDSVAAKWYPSY